MTIAQAFSASRWRSWWPVEMRGSLGERVGNALEQVDLSDRRHRTVAELDFVLEEEIRAGHALGRHARDNSG